jgi:uncharacterized protein YcaQ
MSTKSKQTPATSAPTSVSAESIAIPQDITPPTPPTPPTPEEIKAQELKAKQEKEAAYQAALETVRSFHRVASTDLVHKSALAAKLASVANTSYARLEASLPVLKNEHIIGSVNKDKSRSGSKVERDTSHLEPEEVKAHKDNAAITKAARLLGILPKVAGEQ